MKIGRVILSDSHDSPALLAQEGKEWRRIEAYPDMLAAIQANPAALRSAYQQAKPVDLSGVRWLAPVQPSKIIAIGRNYREHAIEGNAAIPSHPLIFAKLPSSVTDPNAAITWKASLTSFVDYEGELAVIIGREARDVTESDALGYVFGYTCGNDVTARDLQDGDGQWTRGKGLDTFCPLGPWIVTTDEIPDPHALAIRTEVNGETRQSDSTGSMMFSVAHLIAHASEAFTLYPGDVILTGTPPGVGRHRKPPVNLRDGDQVVVEIERIGRLENTCREVG
ncbi:MAG TPA: fumarylacetoacetate hydrolase family protein [Aggregatilineales bacterium]|nr:fumarylacetoacetate hydrolase family protein [Aggregatilineales bacterium]